MFARQAHNATVTSIRSFSTTRAAGLARMSLIGRLGAQPQTATDKQGREILIYSVATTDRAGPAGADGTRPEPTTTWHRVLSYQSAGKDYLSTLPAGSMVHIEADFKKRVTKDGDNYNEQTMLLMRNIDVLARPKKDSESSEATASS